MRMPKLDPEKAYTTSELGKLFRLPVSVVHKTLKGAGWRDYKNQVWPVPGYYKLADDTSCSVQWTPGHQVHYAEPDQVACVQKELWYQANKRERRNGKCVTRKLEDNNAD
jgi:hypothetical protein